MKTLDQGEVAPFGDTATPGFRRTKVTPQQQQEIEQFYYWEASLLDNHHFHTWFELLAEDIHYFAPIRTTRTLRERHLEISDRHSYAHFDDNRSTIKGRIRKLESDLGWSENPPSRTRHLINNVIIEEVQGKDDFYVRSAFLLYRNRLERQVDVFAGERQDLLRRVPTECGFEIVQRTILIDQSTVLANNLSVFF